MRILFVTSSHNSPHILRPLHFLLENGHQVAVLSKLKPKYIGQKQFIHFSFDKNYKNIDIILKEIKRLFVPDIVHIHYANILSYYVIKFRIAPIVLSIWGSDINNFVDDIAKNNIISKLKLLLRSDLKYSLPLCDKIIVDDNIMDKKCFLLTQKKLPIERIPLGVDTAFFYPPSPLERIQARKKFNVNDNDIVILSPRILSSFYGHKQILLSFIRLAKYHSNLHLFLKEQYFDKSPHAKKYILNIKNIIKKSTVSNRIHFIPYLEDVDLNKLYWSVDGIINFPNNDAFPITFYEAAATKTPIITKLLPAYRQTFIETSTIIIEPPDNKLIDLNIELFINNLPFDQKKLDNAYDIVTNNYTFEIYCNRLVKIYNELSLNNTNRESLTIKNEFDGPLISILVSVFNNTELLVDLLQSLINQTYKNWEAIIVDDASTIGNVSETVLSFNESRFKFIKHSINKGANAGRNSAYKISKGQYVMCQDPDDVLHPWMLALFVEKISSDQSIDILYSDIVSFGDLDYYNRLPLSSISDITLNQWIPGSALIKRPIWELVGGWCTDVTLNYGNQDWDFWLSVFQYPINICYIPLPLLYYRKHISSISSKRYYHDFNLHIFLFKKHKNIFNKYGTSKQFLAKGAFNTFYIHLINFNIKMLLSIVLKIIKLKIMFQFSKLVFKIIPIILISKLVKKIKNKLNPNIKQYILYMSFTLKKISSILLKK
jgi:glycosyltransferase involved in cell wall biosynthesis